MAGAHWEHFAHDADIGVRGHGASKAEAFEQAALALMAAIGGPEAAAPSEEVSIQCASEDDEIRFVDWLNAIIYEIATRKMLFGGFEVEIHGGRLNARALGERIEPGRHHPQVEPKGATFTALEVRRLPDESWLAQCVVDV